MFCQKCGAEVGADAVVCVKCGCAVSDRPISEGERNSAYGLSSGLSIYAGFWRRVVAMLIDTIILTIGGFILGAILGVMIGVSLITNGMTAMPKIFTGVAGFIIGITLNWLYFTLLESSFKQATLGKMALGIIVTDINGNRISLRRANGRYWGKWLSGMTIGVGYIMAGFTQKKQALHDIIAETLVVKK